MNQVRGPQEGEKEGTVAAAVAGMLETHCECARTQCRATNDLCCLHVSFDEHATPCSRPASPSQPRPHLPLPPAGRRFVLEGWYLADWLGWSGVLGHSPARGLSAWDLRFKGERLAWEVALQVRMAWCGVR
jgi:hypothetical protein